MCEKRSSEMKGKTVKKGEKEREGDECVREKVEGEEERVRERGREKERDELDKATQKEKGRKERQMRE